MQSVSSARCNEDDDAEGVPYREDEEVKEEEEAAVVGGVGEDDVNENPELQGPPPPAAGADERKLTRLQLPPAPPMENPDAAGY